MYYALEGFAFLCISDIKFYTYVAQVLHGQIYMIPKDWYVSVTIL